MCESYNEVIGAMLGQAEQTAIKGEVSSARAQYIAIIDFIDSRNEPNLSDRAITLRKLADCQRELQRGNDAVENYKKAFEVNTVIGNLEGGIHNLSDIGSIYAENEHYPESIAEYEKALALAMKNGLKELEAITRNNIGYVLMLSGKDEEALITLQESLSASQETGQKKLEAGALANIAMLYRAWGLLDRAKEHFEEAAKLNQEIEDVDNELEDCLGIGSVCYQLGESEQSEKALKRALMLCNQSGTGERKSEIRGLLRRIEAERQSIAV